MVSSADPFYPGPTTYVTERVPSSYIPNDALSSWITMTADGIASLAVGDYDFRTTFDLTGQSPADARITGQWAVDNSGVILLNGTGTGISISPAAGYDAFGVLHPFTIDSGFIPGVNTVDFVVNNSGAQLALRVQIAGTAAIPEPVAASGAAVAVMAGLFGRGRRGLVRAARR